MVLSNAERQKRFRERLKARAAGSDLGEQARAVIDRAYAAIWDALVRNADTIGGGPDTFDSQLAFKQYFAGQPASDGLALMDTWLHPEWETDISDDERNAIEQAAGIYRAALLKHVERPKPVKDRRK